MGKASRWKHRDAEAPPCRPSRLLYRANRWAKACRTSKPQAKEILSWTRTISFSKRVARPRGIETTRNPDRDQGRIRVVETSGRTKRTTDEVCARAVRWSWEEFIMPPGSKTRCLERMDRRPRGGRHEAVSERRGRRSLSVFVCSSSSAPWYLNRPVFYRSEINEVLKRNHGTRNFLSFSPQRGLRQCSKDNLAHVVPGELPLSTSALTRTSNSRR